MSRISQEAKNKREFEDSIRGDPFPTKIGFTHNPKPMPPPTDQNPTKQPHFQTHALQIKNQIIFVININ